MAQMLVRQLDTAAVERLKALAKAKHTSAEALAREAIHRAAAELTTQEKQRLVREMLAHTAQMMAPGITQTSGADLIREARDHDC